ncbi:hypothetical protein [Goodfellowiella coeruleoviolacea]|uniref:Uncharacterized protein n=1 Tax=Goodfellowiella coeruleoviolacea TaxID=334858 RepID=A0AAE3GJZ8_9PSEU|nr:hypothetical protein [Goodfellowiella coeruleoviolacea]MCP2168855.1 hypothetical protein [Goodfellowiella coeruleoviolacea]
MTTGHVWWCSAMDGLAHAIPADQTAGTEDGFYQTACALLLTETTVMKGGGQSVCPACRAAVAGDPAGAGG